MNHRSIRLLLTVTVFLLSLRLIQAQPSVRGNVTTQPLPTEKIEGEGVWLMPVLRQRQPGGRQLRVTVWFEDQFLGNGESYRSHAKTYADWKRTELRTVVVATLKSLSEKSYSAARESLEALSEVGAITNVERHWIVNGFSCNIKPDGLGELAKVPGVRKIFRSRRGGGRQRATEEYRSVPEVPREAFSPDRYLHPWYTRSLLADRVWREFGVTGKGTLNIIHDFNFVFSDNYSYNLYRNPNEIPDNGKDDDGNGLIDDYHGYNFQLNSPQLTTSPTNAANPGSLHGSLCAAIVCGAGRPENKYEFGLAPEARWAGVIGSGRLEAAVEWAIEHQADTYSMSFSAPGLGEFRSHWRKVMEHGSLCGVYFVSGAGNFAQSAQIPVQMRTPEDIPEVVFAAAGVQRNLSRTQFSSKGPVEWELDHYQDGRIQKPEVCAFNTGLPVLLPDGQLRPTGMRGNSFAGPMFCGLIALMLSADSELLPWDLKEIITSTAMDVASEGVDYATGYGLINCYRAVKEVLRRKALREGLDASIYEGREAGDQLDVIAQQQLQARFTVSRIRENSVAAGKGVLVGDVILKCAGTSVANMQQLRAAKAASANDDTVTVVFQRGEQTIPIKFVPGGWGMSADPAFVEPVFQ